MDSTDLIAVAAPTAFPDSGTFGVTQRVTLLSATPDATIHFTLDGTLPTTDSPVFDPFDLPVLEAINDGDRGVATPYVIRALAARPGMATSPVARFDYLIDRRDKGTYLATELHPGIHRIRDFDDTKMVLIVGSMRALLIDAGLGNGNLRGFVEAMTGGLPLDLVITHGHPDHIAATAQFQGNQCKVFLNRRDRPMVERFDDEMGLRIDMEGIDDLEEGMVFNLGDRRLDVYAVPGHSPGHMVLFDEASGLLFASDAVGSNRPTIPDSLWMQFPDMSPIDEYLSALQVFRAKVGGKIKETYGGHNDTVIYGEAYLDNLQKAAQRLVDEGEAALLPSLRPTNAWQVVVGDRLNDPNWAAINVAKQTCLSVPAAEIATLSNLDVPGAELLPSFTPSQFDYTAILESTEPAAEIVATTTATLHRALTVNGHGAPSGAPFGVILTPGLNSFFIEVTAPNGINRHTYRLALVAPAAP